MQLNGEVLSPGCGPETTASAAMRVRRPQPSSTATARMECGGVWGYANLLKILKNRKHPEHKSMKEWLGRAFDAAAFDLETTNLWLRKQKGPRVTEPSCAKSSWAGTTTMSDPQHAQPASLIP